MALSIPQSNDPYELKRIGKMLLEQGESAKANEILDKAMILFQERYDALPKTSKTQRERTLLWGEILDLIIYRGSLYALSRYGQNTTIGINRETQEPIVAPSLLGTDTQTGNNVVISQEQRLKGLYVIGKTGSGKTTLLVNMILQDIEAGRGVCFFDTHGDAITDILRRLPPERENDVILLDVLDKQAKFGLNIFQCTDPTDDEEVSSLNSAIMSMYVFAHKSGSRVPTF